MSQLTRLVKTQRLLDALEPLIGILQGQLRQRGGVLVCEIRPDQAWNINAAYEDLAHCDDLKPNEELQKLNEHITKGPNSAED